MNLYCYTGDVKKLIPNGWIFQKLFARNYKTYRKDGIIMYVISKMCLEPDNIKQEYQPKLIEFILENIDEPDSFWQEKYVFGHVASWVIQKGKIIKRCQAVKNKTKWYLQWEKDNNIPYLEDGERIRIKWVYAIKELMNIGGVELKDLS
jgi:hypothetical protein